MRQMPLTHRAGFVLGGLSLAVFFLGHMGLLSTPFLAATTAVAALVFIYSCWGASLAPLRALTPAEKLIALCCALAVVLLVPLALMPPAVRDELIAHLAIPKRYLAAGGIIEISNIGSSYLPQNIDLLYLVSLAMGSDVLPRVTHLVFAVLTAGLVYSFILPRAGRAPALAGFLIYMTTPIVANLARMAYVDHGVAFYSFLAFVCALRFRDKEGFRWLCVSAAAMGLALGAKYNAMIAFFLIALFVTAVSYRDRGFAAAVRNGAVYCLITLAVLSPWLIRNYVWTGSPLYPLFEAAVSSVARGEGVHVTGEMAPVGKRLLLYGEGLIDIVLLPLRLFWEGADNSIERFDGVLNPLFLVFIPLAFIKRVKDTWVLLAYAFVFFLLAAFTVDMVTRYLMPVIPAVVALVAVGIGNAFGSARLKWPGAVVAAALLALNANYMAGLYRTTGAVGYYASGMDREGYLAATLPDYEVVKYANANLEPGARVLLLFSGDRGYYWQREYIYGDRTGTFFRQIVGRSGDAASLSGALKAYGATHLMVHEAILQRFANDNFDQAELQVLADFFNTSARRLYAARGFSLFELD